jgi:RimJ/RimL family protein N-acetyltransferase
VLAEAHETNTPSRRLLERLDFAVYDLRPPYVWYARDLR